MLRAALFTAALRTVGDRIGACGRLRGAEAARPRAVRGARDGAAPAVEPNSDLAIARVLGAFGERAALRFNAAAIALRVALGPGARTEPDGAVGCSRLLAAAALYFAIALCDGTKSRLDAPALIL